MKNRTEQIVEILAELVLWDAIPYDDEVPTCKYCEMEYTHDGKRGEFHHMHYCPISKLKKVLYSD